MAISAYWNQLAAFNLMISAYFISENKIKPEIADWNMPKLIDWNEFSGFIDWMKWNQWMNDYYNSTVVDQWIIKLP